MISCLRRGVMEMPQSMGKRYLVTSRIPTPRSDFVIIDSRDAERFKAAVASCCLSPYEHYGQIAYEMKEIFSRSFGEEISRLVKNMTLKNNPFLLLKNCPTNPNPGPTPDDDLHVPSKGFIEELFVLGVMKTLYGKIYHDRHEKHGEAFAQIIALRGHEKEQSSRGVVDFGYHTDAIHTEDPINFLTLFCIKGDSEAKTKILTVDEAIKTLPSWVIHGLQKQAFEMRTGPTWPGVKISRVGAILEEDGQGGFFIRYNGDFANRLMPKTKEAGAVLDYFSEHIKECEPFEFCLEKGDCLVINNRKVLHRRDRYEASKSWEERRWVQRAYMVLDPFALIPELVGFQRKLFLNRV